MNSVIDVEEISKLLKQGEKKIFECVSQTIGEIEEETGLCVEMEISFSTIHHIGRYKPSTKVNDICLTINVGSDCETEDDFSGHRDLMGI